jgi:hypothetical protein
MLRTTLLACALFATLSAHADPTPPATLACHFDTTGINPSLVVRPPRQGVYPLKLFHSAYRALFTADPLSAQPSQAELGQSMIDGFDAGQTEPIDGVTYPRVYPKKVATLDCASGVCTSADKRLELRIHGVTYPPTSGTGWATLTEALPAMQSTLLGGRPAISLLGVCRPD